ncbi:glutathione S-transferase E14-like [Wyeomyia smithii]|uniref:glutathione S-transferase E14-like n=1 Tax=Wyeomyia smithii TaxID=174621 RepID=UPI002467E1D5|nr:glutathione S-transferase E14-like [Wyeomyia smithii]XP_055543887.1 glutathione S-transferase E14-like [Wyeomyia smithii]
MSKPILYYDDVSPPVRSVLLTLAALDINEKIDLKWIDLFSAAHRNPDYIQINPLHTVPVLEHDDLVLTDSHAILVYLCDAYGQGTSFSLADHKKRAKVLNRLCFNNSIFFQRDAELMRKIFRDKLNDISAHLKPVTEAIDYIELYLSKTKFIACDELTVADFSIVSTLSTLESVCPIERSRWPKVKAWYDDLQKLPYYRKANQVGLDKLRTKLRSILTAVPEQM